MACLVALAIAPSCASACAAAAEDGHRAQAVAAHVYAGPADDVARAVVGEVARDGVVVTPRADAPGTWASAWRDTNGARSRVVVELVAAGPRTRLVVTNEDEARVDGGLARTSARAGDVELRVLRRLDPARAAAIDAEASQRGDEARASCAACGRSCARAIETLSTS